MPVPPPVRTTSDAICSSRQSPLLQSFPSQGPQKPRTQTTVDAAVFERYVGRYQLAPSAVLTITRDGNRFFVQLTGQPTFEIFAESEKDYFLKVVDAQLTFETDAQNKAVAVVLHQNGMDQRAPRIEGEPVVPKEIAVDPAVLDGYVGRYQLTPEIVITITREQAKLMAQLTGQPAFEVFASAEREFFYKVVNAQLTFEVDATRPRHRRGAASEWPEPAGAADRPLTIDLPRVLLARPDFQIDLALLVFAEDERGGFLRQLLEEGRIGGARRHAEAVTRHGGDEIPARHQTSEAEVPGRIDAASAWSAWS